MKYFMLFSVLLSSIVGTAQDCTQEILLQKPGVWKVAMKGSGGGGTAAELASEKKIIMGIHTMIKSKYTPMSVEALYHDGYMYSYGNMPDNGFSYSIIPLNYYCDGKTIKTVDETPTYFEISANYFDTEIYDTAHGDRSLAEGFNVMYDLPIEKDGYWHLRDIDSGPGIDDKAKSGAWLITYDGKLPFSYVTKKEFLEKRKKSLETQQLEMSSHFKEILKDKEIEKKYKETEYKNDAVKLQLYMKMDYQSGKDRYEKMLADNDKTYKPAFDKIDAQLKLPVDELNQPAIVKQDPNDHLSYLFTEHKDPFAHILIKPNPGYFNKKLPRSSPQFFWVYVRAYSQDPIAARFLTDIMKAVDFGALKNMLGK